MVAVGGGKHSAAGGGGTLATTSTYLCYLLISLHSSSRLGKTYVGVTNNIKRRLRQHNGELVGGARATRSGRPWNCLLTVEGFQTQKQSLQFEWMWKHMAPKKSHGLSSRLTKLQSLLNKERWTEKAPLASSIPLVVTLYTSSIPEQHESKLTNLLQLLDDDDNKQMAADALLPTYVQIIQQTNNDDHDEEEFLEEEEEKSDDEDDNDNVDDTEND